VEQHTELLFQEIVALRSICCALLERQSIRESASLVVPRDFAAVTLPAIMGRYAHLLGFRSSAQPKFYPVRLARSVVLASFSPWIGSFGYNRNHFLGAGNRTVAQPVQAG
jgi:hypothetical protein